jgi:alpha-galactosidase
MGRLLQTYFGRAMSDASDYTYVKNQNKQSDANGGIFNHMYTPSGTWNLVEPALTVKHADGNMSTELLYVKHEKRNLSKGLVETSIVLKDPVYQTQVTIKFRSFYEQDVIEQWTEIKNNEQGTILLEKYASANLNFINRAYYLTHFHGYWAKEMQPEQTKLTSGIKIIDSKLGTRANIYSHPVFMLAFDQPATEVAGHVLLGTLAWSGNFQLQFEVDPYRNLRLIGGINPYASAYPLQHGDVFITPSFIYTYSEEGIGNASRQLHRWMRKYRLMDGEGSRMTLLNNWEATYFQFDEQKLHELMGDAKSLGVDLFLLDDGWFGNKYPRNNPRQGLGDWQHNVEKLPNGIVSLVKEAHKTGVKFGIWVEPEMVNPRSELYEKHPDWVIRQPERPETYFRNQLVLDLSNPEVQDFVYDTMDEILSVKPEISYVKWDCNAVIFNAHSSYLETKGQMQSQLYVDYVKGLYKVLERLRVKYPTLPIMLCSGGGGRVDYEALKYFTEFWPSDNTDPLERVFIQWNYSYFYPSIAACSHITEWSDIDLKFKTDVAMMGKMGYDLVVKNLSDDELKFSQMALENYNRLKSIIWYGDMYRLLSPYENPFASLMYVDEKQETAVAFNYVVSNRYYGNYSPVAVKFQGLDPEKHYLVKEINLQEGKNSPIQSGVYTGEFLMKNGINPVLRKNRTSVVLELKAQ